MKAYCIDIYGVRSRVELGVWSVGVVDWAWWASFPSFFRL